MRIQDQGSAVSPEVEPLTLTEAKAYLRVTDTDEDDLINALITGARVWAEACTGRTFINRTWKLVMDNFPAYSVAFPEREIRLPKGRTQSVSSFTYVNTAGVTTELVASPITGFQMDLTSDTGGLLRAPYDSSWPDARASQGAVQITFVAGYGTTAADVPDPIKLAMRFWIADHYETRGRQDERQPHQHTAAALLAPYVVATDRF